MEIKHLQRIWDVCGVYLVSHPSNSQESRLESEVKISMRKKLTEGTNSFPPKLRL